MVVNILKSTFNWRDGVTSHHTIRLSVKVCVQHWKYFQHSRCEQALAGKETSQILAAVAALGTTAAVASVTQMAARIQ